MCSGTPEAACNADTQLAWPAACKPNRSANIPNILTGFYAAAAGAPGTTEAEVEALASSLFGEPRGQAPSPITLAAPLPSDDLELLGLQELGAVCGALLKGVRHAPRQRAACLLVYVSRSSSVRHTTLRCVACSREGIAWRAS